MLTKQNLVTLRNAHRMAVRYDNGQAFLVCWAKIRKAGYEESEEVRAEIPLDSNVFYGRNIDPEKVRAHTTSIQVDCQSNLFTFVQLAKEGDEVQACWYAANDNQYLKDAGLHADECWLTVKRRNKKGILTTLRFFVDYMVCPDNPARMIRAS